MYIVFFNTRETFFYCEKDNAYIIKKSQARHDKDFSERIILRFQLPTIELTVIYTWCPELAFLQLN